MEIRKRSGMLLLALSTLVISSSCKDGGIFSRETTIFGRVTEIAGQPVDSIQFVITVSKDLGNIKALYRVTSDSGGNYKAIVDPPKGYSLIGISVAGVDNPAFNLVYRGYEVYEDGKKANYCCTAGVGKKKRYDFKLYR